MDPIDQLSEKRKIAQEFLQNNPPRGPCDLGRAVSAVDTLLYKESVVLQDKMSVRPLRRNQYAQSVWEVLRSRVGKIIKKNEVSRKELTGFSTVDMDLKPCQLFSKRHILSPHMPSPAKISDYSFIGVPIIRTSTVMRSAAVPEGEIYYNCSSSHTRFTPIGARIGRFITDPTYTILFKEAEFPMIEAAMHDRAAAALAGSMIKFIKKSPDKPDFTSYDTKDQVKKPLSSIAWVTQPQMLLPSVQACVPEGERSTLETFYLNSAHLLGYVDSMAKKLAESGKGTFALKMIEGGLYLMAKIFGKRDRNEGKISYCFFSASKDWSASLSSAEDEKKINKYNRFLCSCQDLEARCSNYAKMASYSSFFDQLSLIFFRMLCYSLQGKMTVAQLCSTDWHIHRADWSVSRIMDHLEEKGGTLMTHLDSACCMATILISQHTNAELFWSEKLFSAPGNQSEFDRMTITNKMLKHYVSLAGNLPETIQKFDTTFMREIKSWLRISSLKTAGFKRGSDSIPLTIPPLSSFSSSNASNSSYYTQDGELKVSTSEVWGMLLRLSQEMRESSGSTMVTVCEILSKYVPTITIFPKAQTMGPREISIMDIATRIVAGFCESIAQQVGMMHKNDYISKEALKEDRVKSIIREHKAVIANCPDTVSVLTSLDFTAWNQSVSLIWMREIAEEVYKKLNLNETAVDILSLAMDWYSRYRLLFVPNHVFRQFSSKNSKHVEEINSLFPHLRAAYNDIMWRQGVDPDRPGDLSKWMEGSTVIPMSDGFGQGIFGMTSSWVGAILMRFILINKLEIKEGDFDFIQTSDDVLLRCTLRGGMAREQRKDGMYFVNRLNEIFSKNTGMSLSMGKCVPTTPLSTTTMFNSKAYSVDTAEKKGDLLRHLKQIAAPSELIDPFSSSQQIYDSARLIQSQLSELYSQLPWMEEQMCNGLIQSSVVQRGHTQFPLPTSRKIRQWGMRYPCALFGISDWRGYAEVASPAVSDIFLMMGTPSALMSFACLYPPNKVGRARMARLKTLDNKSKTTLGLAFKLFDALETSDPVSISTAIQMLSRRMETDKVKRVSTGEFTRQFFRAWIPGPYGSRMSPYSDNPAPLISIEYDQFMIASDIPSEKKKECAIVLGDQPLNRFSASPREIINTASCYLSDPQQLRRMYGVILKSAQEEARSEVRNQRIFVSSEMKDVCANILCPIKKFNPFKNSGDGEERHKVGRSLWEIITQCALPCLWLVEQFAPAVGPGVMSYDVGALRHIVYVIDNTIVYHGTFKRDDGNPVPVPCEDMPRACPGFSFRRSDLQTFLSAAMSLNFKGIVKGRIAWRNSSHTQSQSARREELFSEDLYKYQRDKDAPLPAVGSGSEREIPVKPFGVLQREVVQVIGFELGSMAGLSSAEYFEDTSRTEEFNLAVAEWVRENFPRNNISTEIMANVSTIETKYFMEVGIMMEQSGQAFEVTFTRYLSELLRRAGTGGLKTFIGIATELGDEFDDDD